MDGQGTEGETAKGTKVFRLNAFPFEITGDIYEKL
jgi:hypothetical protein